MIKRVQSETTALSQTLGLRLKKVIKAHWTLHVQHKSHLNAARPWPPAPHASNFIQKVLEKRVTCPLLFGEGRGEREVFPCGLTLHLPGNGGGIQTSFTFGRHRCLLFLLLLSRYVSPSPCCQSAPVFKFHRSPCRCFSPTTDKMKHGHRNIHFKNKKQGLIHPQILQRRPRLHCL